MRTTWNVPDEVLVELRALARSRKQSVTAVAADVLRAGLVHDAECRPRRRYCETTHSMGEQLVDVTKATRLAFEWYDEEMLRKMKEEW